MEHFESNEFALSSPRDGISNLAQHVLYLSEISEKLATEERTLVRHADGRSENVAEHSLTLAIIAPAIAEKYFPDLDANLIARFATVHDIVEAYVGDTPTHDIKAVDLHAKSTLEAEGLAMLRSDFSFVTSFVAVVDAYEAQQEPEARFVRVLDKCMPALMHFADGGTTLRGYCTPKTLEEDSRNKAAMLREQYPEFETLIALREELSKLIAHEFLSD